MGVNSRGALRGFGSVEGALPYLGITEGTGVLLKAYRSELSW